MISSCIAYITAECRASYTYFSAHSLLGAQLEFLFNSLFSSILCSRRFMPCRFSGTSDEGVHVSFPTFGTDSVGATMRFE